MRNLKSENMNFIGLGIAWAVFMFAIFFQPIQKNVISPLTSNLFPLQSLSDDELKNANTEVFGFLPFWNFHNADNIDFDTLTTLAYFDVKISPDGNLIKDDPGYQSFVSGEATEIFKKAHDNGTRVVLTLTLMNNNGIKAFLDNPAAQERTIEQAVSLVERRGIDGINIDIEYDGDAGDQYRRKFTVFADKMTQAMHSRVSASQVTVSVYASGVKYPKVQDIGEVAKVTDGIFMMGYDFAITSSDVAMPTAPLGGHKEGEYWYDISTAVEDFLTVMPANKLILGTPWYGLSFDVYQPDFKAKTISWYWSGRSGRIETYKDVKDVVADKSGWDALGQVAWKAYYNEQSGTWRMMYIDDVRSMGAKYDLAKNRELMGVGIWALGYEGNHRDMWDLIETKFGNKIADIRILEKPIYELF